MHNLDPCKSDFVPRHRLILHSSIFSCGKFTLWHFLFICISCMAAGTECQLSVQSECTDLNVQDFINRVVSYLLLYSSLMHGLSCMLSSWVSDLSTIVFLQQLLFTLHPHIPILTCSMVWQLICSACYLCEWGVISAPLFTPTCVHFSWRWHFKAFWQHTGEIIWFNRCQVTSHLITVI